jgi:hypothetical protein
MSAFTLGTDHIDLLITVAMRIPGFNEQVVNIPKTADLLGQDLVDENYASVNYRYASHDDPETPPEYHWQPVAEVQAEKLSALLLLQIINAVNCYDYQTCEHPAWTDSKAFWVSQAIAAWCETKLTELKWPKVTLPHVLNRPPAFEPPEYMAWEWDRTKGLDFAEQERDLKRRMGQ